MSSNPNVCPVCGRSDFSSETEFGNHVDSELEDVVTDEAVWSRHVGVLIGRIAATSLGAESAEPSQWNAYGGSLPINVMGCYASISQQNDVTNAGTNADLIKCQLLSMQLCSAKSVATLQPRETDAFRKLLNRFYGRIGFTETHKEPSGSARLVMKVLRETADFNFLPFLVCVATEVGSIGLSENQKLMMDEFRVKYQKECDALKGSLLQNERPAADEGERDRQLRAAIPYDKCASTSVWFPRENLHPYGGDDGKKLFSIFALQQLVLKLVTPDDATRAGNDLLRLRAVPLPPELLQLVKEKSNYAALENLLHANGYFTCPRNYMHQEHTIKKLPDSSSEASRRGVNCASCDMVWCSHCRALHHPRQKDCSNARLCAENCWKSVGKVGEEQIQLNDDALKVWEKLAQQSMETAAQTHRAFCEQLSALSSAATFEQGKASKIADIDRKLAEARTALGEKQRALQQHHDNDTYWIRLGAARCPFCFRQPLVKNGGCDVFGCGSHAHQSSNVNGGCGREFYYSQHKYQRLDDSDLTRTIAEIQNVIRTLEGNRAQVSSMQPGIAPSITPFQPANLWPTLRCTGCGGAFEGVFRLECINCFDMVSLCMKCVAAGKHYDLGPAHLRRNKAAPSIHRPLSPIAIAGGRAPHPVGEIHAWMAVYNGASQQVSPDARTII